jgi:outer membrane protein assembly factor BamD (BamD/ComL family)
MNRLDYLDFDMLFEKSGAQYTARVLNSPVGQAVSVFSLPFSPVEVENLLLRVGRKRQGVRRLESPEMEAARAFGSRLFSAVFSDEILSCLRGSLNESYRLGAGLRIRLRLSAVPELGDLPWEFLYDPTRNQFLTLSVETPLVHYLELPQDIQALPVSPPLQVLVMISSPHDYPPLDVEREWAKLNEALGDLIQRGLVSLTRLDQATLAELQRQLRRGRFHIFHFIGHGAFDESSQDGVLLTEDEQGRGRLVSGYDLGTLLHDHRSLRLAVLNACEGARSSLTDPFAGSAQGLVQKGLPAVIAMQFEITDPAAITLAHEFYAALADGFSVDAALGEARKAIFAQGNDVEWATPVLYLRVPDAAVFKIEAAAERSALKGEDVRQRSGQPAGRTAPPDRRQAEVERLYTQGLSAYWLDEWQQACESFEAVLKLQPEHQEAAARLEAARRNLKSELLSRQALEAEEAGDWAAAIAALEELAGQAPAYKDVAARLEAARKQKQLQDLYAEAHRLSQAENWKAVVKIFTHIAVLDPTAADPDGLQATALKELEAQQRQAELETLYNQALAALDSGNWEYAARLFREIETKEPGYRLADRLLARAEAEIKNQAEAALARRAEAGEGVLDGALGMSQQETAEISGKEAGVGLIGEAVPGQTAESALLKEKRSIPGLKAEVLNNQKAGLASLPSTGSAVTSAYPLTGEGTKISGREALRKLSPAARSGLLTGLGWFLATWLALWFAYTGTGSNLNESIKAATNYSISWGHANFALIVIVAGVISGAVIALLLRLAKVSLSVGQIVLLIIAWGGACFFTVLAYNEEFPLLPTLFKWFLAGALGGLATGALVRRVEPRFDRRALLLTALGFAAGLLLSEWLIQVVYWGNLYQPLYNSLGDWVDNTGSELFNSLAHGVAGIVGGLVLFSLVFKSKERAKV